MRNPNLPEYIAPPPPWKELEDLKKKIKKQEKEDTYSPLIYGLIVSLFLFFVAVACLYIKHTLI